MFRFRHETICTVLGFALVLPSVGCLKKVDKKTETTSAQTTVADTGGPVGVVNNETGFNLAAIANGAYPYRMHRDTGSSVKCAVMPGASAADSDIDCTMDAQELDLYYNGATVHYNVPSSMCSYFSVESYYFYAFPVGQGPTAVTYNLTAQGMIDVTVPAPSGTPANDPVTGGSSLKCKYDLRDVGGPNCCVGTYDLTVYPWDSTNGVQSTDPVVTHGLTWGNASDCLAGPAMETQPKNSKGFPTAVLYFVEGAGANETYEVTAPIKKNTGDNLWVANYFLASDHSAGALTPANIPVSMREQVTGLAPETNPYYTFTCYDRAAEIKARIKLQIRSWKRADQYLSEGGSDTETGDPDFPGSGINDFGSWKDFAGLYPFHFY